ncbi:MAG: DNA polymerase/3'-5' exonuclease PolX [Thermoguttaceae bacterium]|jgi:DNA polymerase (family 10)|nr:DNA polymerase/3'-5' exonuclease PolX [Thermoguttaceae bacterium]
MTNTEIAAVFEQVADLLEFQAANAFRIRAYRNAARTIHDLPEALAEIAEDPERSLTDIDGVGNDLAGKIGVLLATGSLPMLDELLSEIPRSVLAILRVPGLGPKRAGAIYNQLGVTTLDQLREACESQQVRALKGFGAKTEQAILKGLDIAAEAERRMLWFQADRHVRAILDHMADCKGLEQLEPAGSYRRRKDTVGDLDFLAVASQAGKAMDRLAAYPGTAEVLVRGGTKMSIRVAPALQVDLRIVPAESFGAAMQYFTGSKEHNVTLRGRAKKMGLKINEYGVFRGEEQVAGRTEADVYAALGLPCFPSELRENRREFQWADAGELPTLVEVSDIRGDLHMHSSWTDGIATIEAMAEAARSRGLEYIAMTDHSKRVTVAGGLDAEQLRRQWSEVDALNSRLEGITVLKGVEVDILEGGGLDLPDDVLAEADWVMASVHYGQNQPRARITDRIIGALENPHVRAISHPTGRMLQQRSAYEVDLDAVFQAARENHKFLELNAHPARLDLDDVACAGAQALGVPIVISTDAHRPEGLEAMRFGINQARRGGLTARDVVNTRSWAEVRDLLGRGG